jgi:hypothetical protein
VISRVIDFAIAMIVLFGMMIYYGPPLSTCYSAAVRAAGIRHVARGRSLVVGVERQYRIALQRPFVVVLMFAPRSPIRALLHEPGGRSTG